MSDTLLFMVLALFVAWGAIFMAMGAFTALDNAHKEVKEEAEKEQAKRNLIRSRKLFDINERYRDEIHTRWLKHLDSNPHGNYVYIIEDADVTGYYKIGRSRDVKKRLTNFEVKLPMNIRIFLLFKVSDEVKTEKLLHKIYASKRVRGEWFKLDEGDIAELADVFTGKFSQKG